MPADAVVRSVIDAGLQSALAITSKETSVNRILALASTTALLLGAMTAPALAFGAEPGTPGDPDCKGQTTAWVAQGFGGQVEARGIANIADLFGMTVGEVHATVDAFCDPDTA
jgi:hypothetical protein